MEKQYVDDGFPTEFPVIAPFLADIDTSNGKGAIYYRQTESPSVLNRVAAEVQKGFPDTQFTPTHAIIATWEDVAAYNEVTRTSESSRQVRESVGRSEVCIVCQFKINKWINKALISACWQAGLPDWCH